MKRRKRKRQYRIVENEHCGAKTWFIQKKSILGFWYNPKNIDAYIAGCYYTLDEAKESIEYKTTPVKKTVVYENAT